MSTQARPRTLIMTESVAHIVAASSSDTLSGTVTATELDLVDQTQSQLSDPEEPLDSGIDGGNIPDVQQAPATPPRPQLRLMNLDRPIRYIPIHIWPEHLKKVQPRTGRRYYPKRSRTLPKRSGSSPLVREYRSDGELLSEDQDSSDTESIQSRETESGDSPATPVTEKRRGWGHTLLGAVQNAVPKRRREEKQPHFSVPRKSYSLSPLRSNYHPPGLKKRGSRESTK